MNTFSIRNSPPSDSFFTSPPPSFLSFVVGSFLRNCLNYINIGSVNLLPTEMTENIFANFVFLTARHASERTNKQTGRQTDRQTAKAAAGRRKRSNPPNFCSSASFIPTNKHGGVGTAVAEAAAAPPLSPSLLVSPPELSLPPPFSFVHAWHRHSTHKQHICGSTVQLASSKSVGSQSSQYSCES